MNVKYQFRWYPTKWQKGFCAKQFGCVRKAYNWALDAREEAYSAGNAMTWVDADKAFNAFKKVNPYFKEVSSVPCQQTLRHLQTAYTNHKEGRAELPTHKRRHDKQAAEYTKNGFKFDPSTRQLTVAKLGALRMRWSTLVKEDVSSITITKDASDRYFVTLTVDQAPRQKLPATGREVGIDLGLKDFVVTSDGEVFQALRAYRGLERKLRLAQRKHSKCVWGSKGRERARLKAAKIHAEIGDIRKDYIDKITTSLVQMYDVIAIEDLCVKGLGRTHLAKSVYDAGFGMFRRMLTYKCAWYGKELRLCPRFYASSHICSCCGLKRAKKLTLSERFWTCAGCGSYLDRDLNAAKNILAAGQAVTASGGAVRPKRTSLLRRKGRSVEARTAGARCAQAVA